MNTEKRAIRSIALDIQSDWVNVNYSAKPYLDAMLDLYSINDPYYHDTAKSVVLYFLANAFTYRGERAKALKAELKALGV